MTPTNENEKYMPRIQYITTREAAALLKRPIRTVRQMYYDGRLEGIQPGHDILLSKPSVVALVALEKKQGKRRGN